MKIKKFSSILLVMSFLCTVLIGFNSSIAIGSTDSNCTNDSSLKVSCYESESFAEWRSSNGQPYLYVIANNYYDLGKLEGQHIAFQIAWFKLMVMLQAQEYNLPYEIGYSYSQAYIQFIPEEYIEEMQGIADAIDIVPISLNDVTYMISIEFYDVLFLACFFDIWYGQLVPQLSGYSQPPLIQGLCTAIGSFTERRPILAQNIDLSYMMAPTGTWVHSKIRNKETFTFRIGGIATLGGVNKMGVAISVNLLEVLNIGSYGMLVSLRYRYALENSHNAFSASKRVLSTPITLGWNYIIKDRRYLTSMETIPDTYSFTRIHRGTFTFDANIYENPLFRVYMLYPTKYTSRYNEVSELCEKLAQDRKLDKNDLFSILSYYDGTDASIFRLFTSNDPLTVGTVARFLSKSKDVYFWNVLTATIEFGHIRL